MRLSAINHGKENYFDPSSIQVGTTTLLQRFLKDYFAADFDRCTCLHATSSNALLCTHYLGNVIYHKHSHDDVSYRFNGKTVTLC